MRRIVVTERTLREVSESLVIRYAHDATARTFAFVCDYWDKAPGSSRAFLNLSFGGVEGFVRERGVREAFQPYVQEYVVTTAPAPIVVEGVGCRLDTEPMRVEWDFGSAFGRVAFAFRVVAGEVRDTRAEKMDGDWAYFDLETGEPVVFGDPF